MHPFDSHTPVMKLVRLLTLLLVVLAPALCAAQVSRSELVQRIAEAQGLGKLFDEQLSQQRDALQAYGLQVFDKTVPSSTAAADPKVKAVFERFLERNARLFSGEEYMAVWAKAYSETSLTDDDLKAILAYYESPAGKKDGAASQTAMKGFTTWLAAQSQARSTEVLDRLAAELREVLK